ncbi:MAG: hypothetical protein AUI15_18280 [Actinobacteria bacterium 13_2_20CM_2_66_6]|nr:MAG: hypothetical protein AUI15_18280 [Actinobacteria bacterium 13_2_20CM_2_66_6]
MKEGLKQLLQPSTMFESLGIKYAGLVDGHDEPALEEVLTRAKKLREPVVVHVVTEKGHGYSPAVDDEVDKLHGVSAFDPLTGRPRSTEVTYTDVFGEALMTAAARRPEVCAITAAMASSTGLLNFAKEFPDRFFDVGICEQHAVTFAAGLAMAGMHPVVCIYSTFLARAFDQTIMDVALHKLPVVFVYSTFLARAFDQTIMDVALHKLPVVFVIDRAGVTGPDGASHHGIFDLSYLRLIPNLKVAAPKDATELCALLETALATDGPIAIRYPKGPVPATPDLPVEPLPIGRWEELRKGSDAVIFAVGRMVEVAGEAAERLEMQGLSCGVVNARWIKPVDPRIADWARGHPIVLTVEDNVGAGGFGSAVLEALAPHGLAGRVRTLASSRLYSRFRPPNPSPTRCQCSTLSSPSFQHSSTSSPSRKEGKSISPSSGPLSWMPMLLRLSTALSSSSSAPWTASFACCSRSRSLPFAPGRCTAYSAIRSCSSRSGRRAESSAI